MNRNLALFIFSLIVLSLVSGCNPSDRPAKAVEEYLTALVAKDETQLTLVTCADWTPSALNEMNSFQAVTASLNNIECSISGKEGDISLVSCSGFITTTYNGEQQEIDLSVRTYQVKNAGGEFLVCGYR